MPAFVDRHLDDGFMQIGGNGGVFDRRRRAAGDGSDQHARDQHPAQGDGDPVSTNDDAHGQSLHESRDDGRGCGDAYREGDSVSVRRRNRAGRMRTARTGILIVTRRHHR
ncbi:hypothetical protein [Burkholderia cepacia]|uniref:hypothetical protein n=1 Tax=Burkholderia cepacia TaxID=292 RepID=UPI002990047E|nr:hypothetical protein [Burkholderia cepacia]